MGGPRQDRPVRDRLRERLVQQGKVGGQEESCAVQPPTDPKILAMVQEAQGDWDVDRKKATVLLKLAAKKGYVAALILLIAKAEAVNDQDLVIDSLFTLLLHPDVRLQIPFDILRNYVDHLVMLLRQSKHADVRNRRREEVQRLAASWPTFQRVDQPDAADDVMKRLQELLSQAPKSSPTLTPEMQRAVNGETSLSDVLQAARESNEGLTAQIHEMDRKVRSSQQKPPTDVPSDCSVVLNALKSHSQKAMPRGLWTRSEDGWKFSVAVPSMERPSDGVLDVSPDELRLTSGTGELLVLEPMPSRTSSAEARTTWCGKRRQLSVFFPFAREAQQAQPSLAQAQAQDQPRRGPEPPAAAAAAAFHDLD